MKTTSLPVAPHPCSTANSTHCCSGLLKDRPTPTSQRGWRRGPGQTLCSSYIFPRQAAYWHFGLFLTHEREVLLSGAGHSSQQRRAGHLVLSCIHSTKSVSLSLPHTCILHISQFIESSVCVCVCVCMYMSVSLDRECFSLLPTLWVVPVQLLSCVQLFVTPWTVANQAPLSSAISWSLLKFKSFPASESFPMSLLFASGDQSIRASVLASVLPMNIQG